MISRPFACVTCDWRFFPPITQTRDIMRLSQITPSQSGAVPHVRRDPQSGCASRSWLQTPLPGSRPGNQTALEEQSSRLNASGNAGNAGQRSASTTTRSAMLQRDGFRRGFQAWKMRFRIDPQDSRWKRERTVLIRMPIKFQSSTVTQQDRFQRRDLKYP